MLPAVAVVHQTVTVNGRSYCGRPGEAKDIPDHDAPALEANGWTKVSLSGPTSARPTTNHNDHPPYFAARGLTYFDTTLGAPLVHDGQTWRTFSGARA
jgi:hypothetical protein